ncbi:MAG: response regulator [Chloroflexi bacterium]|nr:response regulator [Chloroflexota bacterium]
MSEEVFLRQVKDALANLYDPVHLQVHPLTDILAIPRSPGDTVGEALRKLLWATIETLRPPSSVPPHRPEWLSYRLLWLYYVQLFDQEAVQRELGLAERTFYRRLQEAVEAVASVLWEHHRAASLGDDLPPSVATAQEVSAQQAREKALKLIQEGRRDLVSLSDALAGAVDTVRPLARQRGIALALHAPPELPATCGDPAVLHQVLVNFLLAGLDLARGQSLRLEVVAEGEETLWRLPGLNTAVPREKLAALSTITLCRELVEADGGRLWIRETAKETELGLAIPCMRPRSVLIIDDDADARELLRRLLQGSGYLVREARNAEEVLARIAEAKPDLVLLDVLMPQQDGWKLLQRLKTWEETTTIPVIICSVLSQPDLALALGAADVLQKPISAEALRRALQRALAPPDSEARSV